MDKNILIIGGFGFLGKNINEQFKNTTYKLINISRRNYHDIRNYSTLVDALNYHKPDIIIFAAANVGSINYVSKYPANVVSDNNLMYNNLYNAVNQVNKDIIIINPISNCSYPGYIDIQTEDKWWDGEIHESVLAYGMPKKMGFILSECFKKQYGIKTLNLIMPNSYGEYDYLDEEKTHAMNGIIMRMIKAQKNNDKEFVVWGSGKPIREWLYMPDMASIIHYIIENEIYELPSPINIGQEYGICINDTVEIVRKMLNYDVNIVHDLTKQDGAPKKVLSSKLFKKQFPDFQFTPYNVGIKNTIKYYKKNIV